MKNGHVFVSYSREDTGYVRELAHYYEARGVEMWFDSEIDYGAAWESEIRGQIDACAAFVLVMSDSARSSDWVHREIAEARELDKLILPLLLDTGGVVPAVADLQFDNVIGGKMPALGFSRRLPGWRETEQDLYEGLTAVELGVAQRIGEHLGSVRQGSDRAIVGAIQVELMRVGLDPGPIDGVLGESTRLAVVEFQKRRAAQAKVDGMLGPLTYSLLVTSALGDLAPTT